MSPYNARHRQVALWLDEEDAARLAQVAQGEASTMSATARRLLEEALRAIIPGEPTCRPSPVKRRARRVVEVIAAVPPMMQAVQSAPTPSPAAARRLVVRERVPAPFRRPLTAELMGDPPPGRSALDQKGPVNG